jgi:hypothetical protein
MSSSSFPDSVAWQRPRAWGLPIAFLAVACLSGVWTARPLAAQYVPFGKNKVQYTDFRWQVLSGPRIDVYYYPEEESLAQLALSYAEESYDSLTALFRHRPFRRVPLFIYSTHQHFEQTNVTASFLPEGVAGFTEFLKRRIALPFNGSYSDFRHTIRHELVHFFQLSKRSRVLSEYPGWRGPALPLWWTEGLAERWSSPQDSDDEMFIRDLVLTGRLPTLPSLTYEYSFTAYPLGGQIHQYLGEHYGYGRVADLYESLWEHGSFQQAFAEVYGITLEELDQQWRFDLERTYFPMYADRSPISVESRALLREKLPNFKPAIYERLDGTYEVFFMSPRTGYTAIYRMPLFGGDRTAQPVLQGDKSEEFESLHFFSSRLDISSTGMLVFVSKYLEKDAIQIYDLRKGRVVGRYQFADLVALSSPSWSPDGRKVVFVALSVSGLSDLYILDFETQEHYPITEDHYLESDPDWAPDGGSIVFASDRTESGHLGHSNLYVIDAESRAARKLTHGPWRDIDPRWSPDGNHVVFTSDRSSVHDLYLVDRQGRGGRITNYTGDAFDAEWLPDGSGLVFSGYERRTFNLFFKALKVSPAGELEEELVDAFDPPPPDLAEDWAWEEVDRPVVAEATRRPYRTKFGLDFAAGQAAFAPGFGSAQSVQFLATDMLGNHMLYLAVVARNFSGLEDIFDSFAGQVMYLNLSRRVNWGLGFFRWNGRFVDQAFRDVYQEETVGGFFLASYPFSKFRRLELQTTLEYSDRVDVGDVLFIDPISPTLEEPVVRTRTGWIVTNHLSYVKDNTLWLPTGPIDGVRWNLSAGVATDLTAARAENYQLLVDFRRYFRTSLLTAYSVRLFGYFSDGAIPERIAIGGPYTLRLYPFLGFVGSRVWMLNQEWRFPILHGVAFAFPFGTLRFPGIQGGVFLDLSQIWLESRDPEVLWGSYGIGFRMPILYPLVMRLDVGKRFKSGRALTFPWPDFKDTEVDFFFGFNF